MACKQLLLPLPPLKSRWTLFLHKVIYLQRQSNEVLKPLIESTVAKILRKRMSLPFLIGTFLTRRGRTGRQLCTGLNQQLKACFLGLNKEKYSKKKKRINWRNLLLKLHWQLVLKPKGCLLSCNSSKRHGWSLKIKTLWLSNHFRKG